MENKAKEIGEICQRLGMSASDLADAAGINRETMRKYVNGYQPIPNDKLSALRLVEQNRNLVNIVREDAPAYRVSSVALDVLPTELLRQMKKIYAAHEPETSRIMHSLECVMQELRQRGQEHEVIKHEPKRAPDPSSILTAKEKAIGAAFVKREIGAGGEHESSSPHSGADERPAHKSKQPGPSGPGSNAPRPSHGGKGQK